jgi:hypothetical protein
MINKKTYLVITPFFPSDNCFIGNYIFEVVDVVNRLVKEEKLLSIVSKGAYNMSLNFDWKK